MHDSGASRRGIYTHVWRSSLRANGSRECAPDDRLREAIHSFFARQDGLLRSARNDGPGAHLRDPLVRNGSSLTKSFFGQQPAGLRICTANSY